MERLIYILLNAHSGVRWLVLFAAVVAILKFAWGWLKGDSFKGMDRGLAAAFSGLFDLQVTLGIVFMLWSGFTSDGFPRFRFEHAFVMFLALVAAHLPARWKKADDKTRFRNSMFSILVSVILVLIGILTLPGGLSR